MSDFGRILDILGALDPDERRRALALACSYLDSIAIKRGFINYSIGEIEFKIYLN